MARNIPTPFCVVCGAPSVAKQLCDKHYRRLKNFGDVDGGLRPKDWGSRQKHPLYQAWTWTNRGKVGRASEWNDFWRFVSDVGERPNKNHRLRRQDKTKPFGPKNFYWKETLTGSHYTTANAEGRKQYQRDWRAANPLRAKAHGLKKAYGITLERFHDMMEAQGGKCAICKQKPERHALNVDHCHATGKVRGLLCHKCNRALGLFRDSQTLLANAISYLSDGQGLASGTT